MQLSESLGGIESCRGKDELSETQDDCTCAVVVIIHATMCRQLTCDDTALNGWP